MDIGSYKSYNTPSVPNPTSSLVHRTSSGGRRPPSCRLRRAHQEAAGLQSTKPPCHQGGRRRQPTPIPTPPNPIPTPPTPIPSPQPQSSARRRRWRWRQQLQHAHGTSLHQGGKLQHIHSKRSQVTADLIEMFYLSCLKQCLFLCAVNASRSSIDLFSSSCICRLCVKPDLKGSAPVNITWCCRNDFSRFAWVDDGTWLACCRIDLVLLCCICCC